MIPSVTETSPPQTVDASVAGGPEAPPALLRSMLRARPAAVALAGMIALSIALRAWAAVRVSTPWIPVDETIYAKLGLSLYSTGKLAVLGGPTGFYSLVYPAFVGVPLTLGGLVDGYTALKVLQALVISLAAVPVYLWTRSLASRRVALLAAALALAPPGLAYTGLIMTEVAFYPLLVLVAWAGARALADPSPRRQALATGAIILACATRLQAIVLLPALLTAALLLAALERRWAPLARLAPTWVATGALAAGWAVWRVASGRPLLGAYTVAAHTSYGLGSALREVAWHAGDLVLLTALFPVAAVLLLLLDAVRGRERCSGVRAYLAIAASFCGWTLVEVGVFASRHVDYLAERNLFSLAPLLFVGFAVWVHRGGPGAQLAASLSALVALGAVLVLPLGRFLSEGSLPFSPVAAALWRVIGDSPVQTQQIVVFGAAGAAAAVFAILPRRLVVLLPLLALAALAAESVLASRTVADAAHTQQVRFLGPVKRWVDLARPGPTAYLYDGDHDWDAVWENVFWNGSIERVYDLPGTSVVGALPQSEVALRDDGTLVPAGDSAFSAAAVVASTDFTFFGTQLAEALQSLPGQSGLRLWRLELPPRVSTRSDGFAPNGDVYGGGTATVTVYACGRGRLRLTLLVKEPQRLELRRDGRVWQRLDFRVPTVWHGIVPTAAGHDGGGTCTYEIAPSGLLGSTVVLFERL